MKNLVKYLMILKMADILINHLVFLNFINYQLEMEFF